MNDLEMPPATTFGELDIQLRVMRADIHRLVSAMSTMATRADIDALARRLDGYATHDDVRAVRTEVELLRKRVEAGSVASNLEKFGNMAKQVSAIVAFIVAAAYFIVGLIEKVPK